MATDLLTAARGLLDFIDAAPSPYHAVARAAADLERAGFVALEERDSWTERREGRFFVVSGGSLVAWVLPSASPPEAGFRVLAAHTDSPNLRVKPRPDVASSGWRQVGIEVYGGVLLNSWLDRDLGLSGRVVVAGGGIRLVRIDRPILRVPQLAIHLDREVNERGLVLDRQQHLTPIWALGTAHDGDVQGVLAHELGLGADEIISWDLMTHDLTPASLFGLEGDLIAAARLDNLCSCFAALTALTTGAITRPTVVALFDHEEVGSASRTGAGGPLLERMLRRSVSARGGTDDDFARSMASSVCVSLDMAHAVHPNYVERHEPNHRPLPNRGPVLKVNPTQRYATDAMGAALFIEACHRADVPHQVFVSRNNMPCGSTIGPITATRLGMATVDAGCAQLSMHSARELMGAYDVGFLVQALAQLVA
jgi:aspartyl aminopeptidase